LPDWEFQIIFFDNPSRRIYEGYIVLDHNSMTPDEINYLYLTAEPHLFDDGRYLYGTRYIGFMGETYDEFYDFKVIEDYLWTGREFTVFTWTDMENGWYYNTNLNFYNGEMRLYMRYFTYG